MKELFKLWSERPTVKEAKEDVQYRNEQMNWNIKLPNTLEECVEVYTDPRMIGYVLYESSDRVESFTQDITKNELEIAKEVTPEGKSFYEKNNKSLKGYIRILSKTRDYILANMGENEQEILKYRDAYKNYMDSIWRR